MVFTLIVDIFRETGQISTRNPLMGVDYCAACVLVHVGAQLFVELWQVHRVLNDQAGKSQKTHSLRNACLACDPGVARPLAA